MPKQICEKVFFVDIRVLKRCYFFKGDLGTKRNGVLKLGAIKSVLKPNFVFWFGCERTGRGGRRRLLTVNAKVAENNVRNATSRRPKMRAVGKLIRNILCFSRYVSLGIIT